MSPVLIPIFNRNLYRDTSLLDFTYERTYLDDLVVVHDIGEVKDLSGNMSPIDKLSNIFIECLSNVEWAITLIISCVIFPMLSYEQQEKCKLINTLSQRAINERFYAKLPLE